MEKNEVIEDRRGEMIGEAKGRKTTKNDDGKKKLPRNEQEAAIQEIKNGSRR